MNKAGYESDKWREFFRRHDDLETYNRMVCQSCHNERPYCWCVYPRFERMGEE